MEANMAIPKVREEGAILPALRLRGKVNGRFVASTVLGEGRDPLT